MKTAVLLLKLGYSPPLVRHHNPSNPLAEWKATTLRPAEPPVFDAFLFQFKVACFPVTQS